jgi:hypothetical protein
MSRCNAADSAARFFIALRYNFIGFWFRKIPVRESCSL